MDDLTAFLTARLDEACLGSCTFWPCPDLRDLASAWSDHPDYRQEWAPAA
jgi:hypothetical protein